MDFGRRNLIDTVSKMKKKRFIFCVVATFLIVSQAFSQTLTEPKLTGSWIGGEDFGEFIYHKTEELGYLLVESKWKNRRETLLEE